MKHNINNLEYLQKLNNTTVLSSGEFSVKNTSPISHGENTDNPPFTRKRSQTRILNTERQRELLTDASIVLENLKTALEGKMEVNKYY